jgi:hypothetical protein
MGVAEQLGIEDEDGELLALAARRWRDWARDDGRLDPVTDLGALRPWLKRATERDADEVLQALARRAAIDGGDDRAAAATLAWALLPGACLLAHRLRTLSERIDEVVAAQLWLEIRSFAWERLTRVAANILMNTRTGVLMECDAASQLARHDPTWHQIYQVEPDASFWGELRATHAQPEPTAAEELLDLLSWACDNRVISDQDRSLLLSLVAAADRSDATTYRRGRGGLLSNELSEQVAKEFGIAPVTVRRRAGRSIEALSQVCQTRRISA